MSNDEMRCHVLGLDNCLLIDVITSYSFRFLGHGLRMPLFVDCFCAPSPYVRWKAGEDAAIRQRLGE